AKVIDGSRVAVEALLDVAENGRSEMARVQAAKELLDRAGVQQDQHVHIHTQDEEMDEDEFLSELRRRLSVATDRLRITAIPVESYEEEVVPYQLSPAPADVDYEQDDDVEDAVVVEPGNVCPINVPTG